MPDVKQAIDVTAAIVLRKSEGITEYLLTQRPRGKSNPLYWEFPGGKVHQGETEEECLTREIHEELGVKTLKIHRKFVTARHDQKDSTIVLHGYLCTFDDAENIVLHEHNDAHWVPLDKLQDYKTTGSDAEFIEKLVAEPIEYDSLFE